MNTIDFLVIGAGVTGLSFANWIRAEARASGRATPELLILEASSEPGGYCKTVFQDGFVWDYSGHFFHFAHPEIEAWLRERMPGQGIRTVSRRSLIRYGGRDIDFPFQKNIHQLAPDDFVDCLYELYFRESSSEPPASFKQMVYQRFGRGIAERFLVPYNEKLYACDLNDLDVDAMGRFFPHADIGHIIRNMRYPDNAGYNSTFTYPSGGAIQYIHALLSDLPDDCVGYNERLLGIDLDRRVATTSRRQIRYQHLISSAPFNQLAGMTGIDHDPTAFTWNKVLVLNLGFDGKGRDAVHWMYFPDRSRVFYRVGWYDNVMGTDRMSLYVEVGLARDAAPDVETIRSAVLEDLEREGIVTGQKLVSWHSVVLDPAYVHVTRDSLAEFARVRAILNASGIHPVGRYGRWTYCSIEDNIVETRDLARELSV